MNLAVLLHILRPIDPTVTSYISTAYTDYRRRVIWALELHDDGGSATCSGGYLQQIQFQDKVKRRLVDEILEESSSSRRALGRVCDFGTAHAELGAGVSGGAL